MRSSTTTQFCKLKTCPSAASLLRFTQGALDGGEREKIGTHLLTCDFCGAETHLLTKHRPTRANLHFAPAEMPHHLRHLAQVLLARTARHAEKLPETLGEAERFLTLTDA